MKTVESIAGDKAGKKLARRGVVTDSKIVPARTLKGVKLNPVQPKDYATKQRDKWLNKLANELRINHRQFPFPDRLPREICPEWVGRVQQEYFRATYPELDLKDTKELTVVEVAGFLGYQCAFAVSMMECVEAEIKDATKNSEKHKKVDLSQEERETRLNYLYRLNEWYGGLRRLAGRALKSCVYQTYADMSAFLIAFSGAFSRKPKIGGGLGNFGSMRFVIYHFMLWNWREIEGLASVRDLHEMLRKHLGKYGVGSMKRIEKICQHIDLHLRKPGRPKASK